MRKVEVLCPAKINLTLDVLDKLENGYHNVRMIMQTVSLYDKVTVMKIRQSKIGVNCNYIYVPRDRRNIACKAAEVFFERTKTFTGINIRINKRIPVGAGLAGGSADAAGVLVALNAMMNTNLSIDELCEIGKTLGADIPFCLKGGTKLAEGIGDIISDIPPMPDCFILLAKPKMSIQTKRVYSKLDETVISKRPDTEAVLQALKEKDLNLLSKNLYNVFEPISSAICPDIPALKKIMLGSGALGAVMSGSGSTVLGIFDNLETAEDAFDKCIKITKNVFICRPVAAGTSLINNNKK